jgi:hypothetical protein
MPGVDQMNFLLASLGGVLCLRGSSPRVGLNNIVRNCSASRHSEYESYRTLAGEDDDRDGLRKPKEVPGDVELGPQAQRLFGAPGLDMAVVRQERRRFATTCLDWTERQPHLGGALGAALWAELVARGWIVRRPGTRTVIVTSAGARGLKRRLGVAVD